MTNDPQAKPDLRKAAVGFASVTAQLGIMLDGMRKIAEQLNTSVMIGNSSQYEPIPDMLRDRTMFYVAQLQGKVAELSRDLLNVQEGKPSRLSEPLAPIEDPNRDSYTLDQVIAAFVRYLPPSLIGAQAIDKIKRVAAHFPAILSRSFLFEHRLKASDPLGDPQNNQVDLSLMLNPKTDQGRTILAGKHPTIKLDPEVFNAPAWDRIRNYCQAWGASGAVGSADAVLAENIITSWLEFDLDTESSLPTPSMFFNLSETLTRPADEVITAALRILIGDYADSVHAHMEQCLNLMPHDAKIQWCGAMLSRPESGVRFCIDMPKDKVTDYAHNIGWQGNLEELELLLKGFGAFNDLMILTIEVTAEGVSPLIGFECRYVKYRQPSVEPRWQTFLSTLARAQLISAEKINGLLSWTGFAYHNMEYLDSPQVLTRILSHVKIQYQTGVLVRAKGYLSATVRDTGFKR